MKVILLKVSVTILLYMLTTPVNSQEVSRRPLTLSLFTVATQLPGGKVTPIHPGLEIGTEFRYNTSDNNQWLQTAKAGIYHHQYSQTALQLYSEVNYRKRVWQKIYGDIKLGGGYLHAIPDLQTFVLKDGHYVKDNNWGRAQFMVSAAIGARYRLTDAKDGPFIFVTYQCFLQMPFIKSYVPILPNTAIHTGISFPFFKVKKPQK